MLICKDDMVVVLSGTDAGEKGRVLVVDREKGKVVVEGISTVEKHVRRSKRNPQGGRLSKEMPLSQSKVQVVCPSCGKPTRIGSFIEADGSKFRVCKKCGAKISQIAPPKKQKAGLSAGK
ncbi:MAG: 50S ribosomal protein L24 [Thermoguttaceae bacterium]